VSRVTETVIDKVDQDEDVDFEDVEEEERQRLDAAFDEVEDLEAMDSDNDSDPLSDDGNITDPDSDAEVKGLVSPPTFNGETRLTQPQKKRLTPTMTNKVKPEVGVSLRLPMFRAPPARV